MDYTTHNGVVLCDVCEKFKDIDQILSRKSLTHHGSYTELCRSAERGCHLCQAFLRAHQLCNSSEFDESLEMGFDENMDINATQIIWEPESDSGQFIIWQKKLSGGDDLRYFNISVELFTEADDPLSVAIRRRPISNDLDSNTCVDVALRWIETCKKEHTACSLTSDGALPTRVIDVGSDPQPKNPILFVTEGQKGSWATLSHCWGGSTPLTTTIDTIDLRKEGISFGELPPTFRDAIILTRKLGFRYLWIDSLCITQDSHEDWAVESAKMHEIYAGASLNISVSSGWNSQSGIFKSANQYRHLAGPLVVLPCYSTSRSIQGLVSFRLKLERYPMLQLSKEPLHSRAWVMQESILSPRRLDFGSTQLHWSCRSTNFSEGMPDEAELIDPLYVGAKNLFQIPFKEYKAYPDLKSSGVYSTPMSWWYGALESYFQRGITKQEDLLPAIGAVAKEISERSGYHYKAGLWLEDLPRGLLWQRRNSTDKSLETFAPSWSWASTSHPNNSRSFFLDVYRPEFRVKVLEADATNKHNNPFGKVISASLKLQGHTRPLGYWHSNSRPIYNENPDMYLFNQWLLPWSVNTNQYPALGRVLCTLDERSECENCHSELVHRGVICIQVAKFGHLGPDPKFWHLVNDEVTTVYALMLEPTGRAVNEYKRIGIAEIPEDDGMADDWEVKVVTIV